ncbi:DegT/DnrJ/EryC1/StrS family aminotransferase [candidate division KSB1 bacterium]
MGNLALNGGSPVRTAPFPSWPVWDERELESVKSAIESGKWGYPNWEFVPRFEEQFAAFHDAGFSICFNSGTTALMAALWAVGVQPGDEVILPAYTFIATATAAVQLGAIPVFADIEKTSFHINAYSVEEKISPKTAAVIAVHIGGRPADLSRLSNICRHRNIKLIEDAAQAWGSEWRNKRVGALGDAGIFSFQSSKNITAGEGGIVLTNDEETASYCRSFCNCGRIEGKPRYDHYYIGGNYRMSEIQAAMLQAQFERYPELIRKRQMNAEYLNNELASIPFIFPVNESEDVSSNSYHLFLMRYKEEYCENAPKSRIVEAMRSEGIPLSPGYTVPVYRQPVFLNGAFGPKGKPLSGFPDYNSISLPETELACASEGLWLTQNVLLGSEEDMRDIITGFEKLSDHAKELA